MSVNRLLSAGANSLRAGEIKRMQQEVEEKQERQTRSQYTATAVTVDAEQGFSIVESSNGTFYAEAITNRALEGGAVSVPRGVTVGKIDDRPVSGDGAIADDSGAEDGDGTGNGDGDDGGSGDGEEPEPPYCQSQSFWYRGTGYKDPGEDEEPVPGQCDSLYNVAWTWQFIDRNGWRLSTPNYANGYPPFDLRVYQPNEPRPDGSTAPTATAYLSYHDASGNEVMPTATTYDRANASSGRPGKAGWVRFCRGGGAPSQGTPNGSNRANPSTGYGSGDMISGNPDGSDYRCSINALPDDCGQPSPPYGPPTDTPPDQWQAICSASPPIKYILDTNSDRSLITVWDGSTTESNPLAQLDFEPGQYEIDIRCKEEGPPA